MSDIPYTLNGKRVESAARAVARGEAATNLGSLRNPLRLDEYVELFRKAPEAAQ